MSSGFGDCCKAFPIVASNKITTLAIECCVEVWPRLASADVSTNVTGVKDSTVELTYDPCKVLQTTRTSSLDNTVVSLSDNIVIYIYIVKFFWFLVLETLIDSWGCFVAGCLSSILL